MASLARATSLSRSSSIPLPAAAAPRAPLPPRRAALRVRAEKDGGSGGALAALQRDVAKFVSRYDPVTTATGSLVVGAYCVMVHGQSPWEALQVSAMASVVGMLANELLFLSEGDSA